MLTLEVIDSVAALYPSPDMDPQFYSAKEELRREFPEADMIEIVPGDCALAAITVVRAGFDTVRVLI